MPVFDVVFTEKRFKTLPDGTQQQQEALVGSVSGIVALSEKAAIGAAGAKLALAETKVTPEQLLNSTVATRVMVAG